MAMLHPDHPHDRPRSVRSPLMLGLAAAALLHGGLVLWIARQTFAPPMPTPDVANGMIMEVYRPAPLVEPPPTERTATPRTDPRPTIAPRTPAPAPTSVEALPIPPARATASGDDGPPVLAPPPSPPAAKQGPAAAPEPVIRAPALLSKPAAADLARFYPERAERLGVEGRTEISCTVSAAGRAETCRLLDESPGGHGFGKAALDLARTFRFSPRTVDGRATGGGEVRIPLRWTLY